MYQTRLVLAIISAMLFCIASATFAADIPIQTVDLTQVAVYTPLPTANSTNPVTFRTSDGKEGWIVKLGNEVIPTPAYAKGKIFTGAGFKSSQFYALDAQTGKTVWTAQSIDGGPTSPVEQDDQVMWSSESCDLQIYDSNSGSLQWSQNIGDSLITAPAVAGLVVLAAHPVRNHLQHSDRAYKMFSANVKTGANAWDADVTGDILSAPIVLDQRAYLACTNGMIFCLDATNGSMQWMEKYDATSAPVAAGKVVAFTVKVGPNEGIKRFSAEDGTPIDKDLLVATPVTKSWSTNTMRADWNYQGPKIAASSSANRMINAITNVVNCVELDSGKVLWRSRLQGSGLTAEAQVITPPALAGGKAYMGTAAGQIVAINQADGKPAFAYNIRVPMASQPIVAEGNVYVTTHNGYLICLKTGDKTADGWYAWGGNAGHNKVD